ncbi:MAG TPA: 3-isopropylmalate dehydratase large subunit [Steroidobacteraceae bacterium]|nr:3-isopropylmalate dehydratase large subunit [Steroidobacteraceae bacterium]
MPATLFEKIWNEHLIADTSGGGLLLLDRIFLHERTGGVALQSLRQSGHRVANPAHVFATMDHVIDTRPGSRNPGAADRAGNPFIEVTRREARAAGIHLFDTDDPRQGIVHVIGPELGIVLPGLTLVCPDSHTGTQGAIGALAWGIGSSDAEHALATQTLRIPKPKTLRVFIDGTLQAGVTAKDLALHLIGMHGASGARGFVVEFAGPAVRRLDLEARMTLCNMATELSAFAAIIAPDEQTFAYLRGRPFAPPGERFERAASQWQELRSDPDARFDLEIHLDASEVRPMITWGTNPQDALPIDGSVPDYQAVSGRLSRQAYERALSYMGLEQGRALAGLPIDGAFIGACTNSRLSDLRRAAALLKGRRVAPGVRAICVPGSTQVKRLAEAEGLASVFERAGFEWRESGCSMCFFAGGESFAPGQRVVSSTNRNFEGRQGPQTRTHLASPETVAASAIAGHIADPRTGQR